ncbi:MAG: glycosyltransferase family 39 protein [Flavobacteriales bacterium]|nr:glycosyltransferase family 39 protein [Flavobacteriales bacterium]MEB2342055.1 glycosyltransferase family 39 protein [Flavobacteriia bacterium]
MRRFTEKQVQWLVALVAALLFIPGLGAVHLFDWDEINFAEIAREMLATGNWLQPQIGYVPFHEKPPLFMWMQALGMSVFGVNEFAARLPNAVAGIITVVALYRIGRRWQGGAFGLLWALAYVGSVLPHLYFRSGIIDPWFNLFIFLGFLAFIRMGDSPAAGTTSTGEKNRAALFAGLWLGLAVLTKGPVGILLPALAAAAYWALNRFRPYVSIPRVLLMSAVLLAVPGLWFGIDAWRNGPEFITAFFWRQVAMLTTEDAGHGGFFGYHVVVLLIGCFPASVFALQEMVKPSSCPAVPRPNDMEPPTERPANQQPTTYNRRRWMLILFWVVLVLFSLVKTKIVHYSSLCYFPLTYLAALQLHRLWQGGAATLWSRVLMGGIGSLFAAVTLALPFLGKHPEWVAPLLANDPFAQGNLQAEVTWTGWEALAGVWMAVAVLFLGHRFFSRVQYRSGIVAVFGGTALFVTITLYYFINRIEGYSQRAAVEFFEQRQGEQCYVMTKDYKSYAQWFYGRVPPITDPRAHSESWLLSGDTDRPVYVSCKITDADEVAAIPGLKELYRKNGFVFFERKPEIGRGQ